MSGFDFPFEFTERVKVGALVISGSRSFAEYAKAPWAREQVRTAVSLAKQRGWCVVVGDAMGVDSYAIVEAHNERVPVIVMGCHAVGRLRAPVALLSSLACLIPGGDKRGSCYVIRDEALCVLAAKAPQNGFYGVWDGVSRGTVHTANFAKRYGVPGVLVSQAGRETWERAK